ncbi:hypothetical protein [Curtobacterium flaccumfaciens]|uniref:hypothetical protein n=1 Tax=Curtobacterium flaccumfaciens TaxID=2035 RepID=UPI001601C111|nr:hypothetical protein [Curtobacterium flaccumfaciens]MBB1198670.1 hypothetical protein [Curtobacterium flaccumfaciens]
MKNIVYGSSTVLVSDDVAEALMHYGAALAMARTGDVVNVPTVDDEGFPMEASLLLGPGVPMLAMPAPDDALEQEAPEFVADLTDRMRAALAG